VSDSFFLSFFLGSKSVYYRGHTSSYKIHSGSLVDTEQLKETVAPGLACTSRNTVRETLLTCRNIVPGTKKFRLPGQKKVGPLPRRMPAEAVDTVLQCPHSADKWVHD